MLTLRAHAMLRSPAQQWHAPGTLGGANEVSCNTNGVGCRRTGTCMGLIWKSALGLLVLGKSPASLSPD